MLLRNHQLSCTYWVNKEKKGISMDTNPPSFIILATLFLSFFFTFMNILYFCMFSVQEHFVF